MKKIILMTGILVLAIGAIGFAEDKGSADNGVSLMVQDLTKLSIGSLSGDVSYTRRLNSFDFLRLGLSGGYSKSSNDGVSQMNSCNAGLSIENLFTLDRGRVHPYAGIGAAADYSISYAGADYSRSITTFAVSGLLPCGLDVSITDFFSIGVEDAICVKYSQSSGTEYGYATSVDSFAANFLNPKLYFTIWF